MSVKYSLIEPYINRPSFWNTLMTFDHFYRPRSDWEVVILEDKKNVLNKEWHIELCEIMDHFKHLPLTYRRMSYDNFSSPCSMRNDGVDIASGKFVIQTSPECAHVTDVLGRMDSLLEQDENSYLVASCRAAANWTSRSKTFDEFKYTEGVWYQHTVHDTRNFHWCSCLSKKNFIAMGGFNEDQDNGLAYDDNHFINAIYRFYKVIPDDIMLTVHQVHPVSYPVERVGELAHKNAHCATFKSRFKLER